MNRKESSVRVMCADGVERAARFTAEADTFFSRPARVTVKGRTVSGFAWSHSAGHLAFTAQGVNAALTGLWPEQCDAAAKRQQGEAAQ